MKIYRSAIAIAISVIALTACSDKPVIPIFETLVIDTLIGSPTNGCRVEFRYLTITNTNKSKLLKAIEAENIAYFFQLEEFEGNAKQAADRAIIEIAELFGPEGVVTEGEVSIEAEASVLDTLLTYTISRYSFTGGAHGLYSTTNHTYTLKGGYELMLSDLFTDEQRPQLDTLIRSKLYEQYNARNDDELSSQGFFPEYIAASENYQITPQGMTFFYNPYEIGCYALGGVEVSISRLEMGAINSTYTAHKEAVGPR